MPIVQCGECGKMAGSADALYGHDCQPPAPAFPLITEAAKLTLKPGDVLVLRIDGPVLSRDMHDGAKRWLEEQLPPGIHTLILSSKESLQVLQTPKQGSEEGKAV